MTNDKNNGGSSSSDKQDEQKTEHVQNPFEGGEGAEITQEDIDNEQKFKEALSERD